MIRKNQLGEEIFITKSSALLNVLLIVRTVLSRPMSEHSTVPNGRGNLAPTRLPQVRGCDNEQ